MVAGRTDADNLLLAGLPKTDRARFLGKSSLIALDAAAVVQKPGERIRAAYFPTTGSISLIAMLQGQGQLQVGLVGDEGMLGTPLILGVAIAPALARVQDAGTAWRIDSAAFRAELALSETLRRRLQLYVHVVMCQSAQTVVCSRFHLVASRLARWLLMTRDCVHSDHLHATHEMLASILGVRRAGITDAAGAFQRQKLIHYSRGDITVLDRRGLEASACECYVANRNAYARTML